MYSQSKKEPFSQTALLEINNRSDSTLGLHNGPGVDNKEGYGRYLGRDDKLVDDRDYEIADLNDDIQHWYDKGSDYDRSYGSDYDRRYDSDCDDSDYD
jgi:hypothetical protein